MRHVRSILYATVLAPAIWVLAGMGFGHRGTNGGVVTGMGLIMVLLSGFAYAILLFAPISPAGPLTGGGLFLIASLWALTSPTSYAGLWPAGATASDLARPGYGPAALLAVPLIATALSARRWETYEPPELPLIGRLGRSHGVAKPTGPPAAALETAVLKLEPAVLKTVADPDSTVVVLDTTKLEATHGSDTTIAIPQNRPPVLIPGTGPVEDSTIVIPAVRPDVGAVTGPDDDATIVVPVRPSANRDVKSKDLIPEKIEPAEADRPTPVSPADVTQVIPLEPGSETQVIARDLGSDTQVIRRDLGSDTQVIRPPAKRQPADADETQVIRLSARSGPAADSDETQVINLNARPAAAGPAERPVQRAATSTAASGRAAAKRGNSRTARHRAAAAAARQRGEESGPRQRRRAAVAGQRAEARAARQRSEAAAAGQRAEPAAATRPTPTARPSSIADAERPDPAADPTTRLGQVPGSPADENTVDGRTESASHAERPADESADDTRRLTLPTIPGPRRRPDGESD